MKSKRCPFKRNLKHYSFASMKVSRISSFFINILERVSFAFILAFFFVISERIDLGGRIHACVDPVEHKGCLILSRTPAKLLSTCLVVPFCMGTDDLQKFYKQVLSRSIAPNSVRSLNVHFDVFLGSIWIQWQGIHQSAIKMVQSVLKAKLTIKMYHPSIKINHDKYMTQPNIAPFVINHDQSKSS